MICMLIRPLATLPTRLLQRGSEVWQGVLLCAAIAAAATVIGQFVPVVGSAIPAVVIGIVVASLRKPAARFAPGIGYAGKFVLQLAVVLLGAQLSLASILVVGLRSLPVMLSSLCACLLAAWLLGRLLRIDRDLNILLGVGTGICGASAIAAVSPVIRARNESISYAISTVFLFNVLAVLCFPALGHLLGMSPRAFGLFAGTAVNDTSSVVAAASVFGAAALGYAVVVKLVRTLMIIPISVSLAVIESRRESDREPLTLRRVAKLIPWFLVGFLVMASARSIGVIPAEAVEALTHISVFFVATALAGIGLSTDLRAIRSAGLRPLLLGGLLSLVVLVTTLLAMWLTGELFAG